VPACRPRPCTLRFVCARLSPLGAAAALFLFFRVLASPPIFKKITAFYECSYFLLLASYLFECLLSLSFFARVVRFLLASFIFRHASLVLRASIQLGSRYRASAFRFETALPFEFPSPSGADLPLFQFLTYLLIRPWALYSYRPFLSITYMASGCPAASQPVRVSPQLRCVQFSLFVSFDESRLV
jgi:hypothetical protein